MRVLVTTPSLPEPAGGEIARIATNGARACVLVGGAHSFVVASPEMRSDGTPTPSVEHALIAVESSGNDPGDAIGWDLLALVWESELVHVRSFAFGEPFL